MFRSLLKEIHNQPEHVRLLIMWLCVFISFAAIGYIWFMDFQDRLVALLNPQAPAESENFYARLSSPFKQARNSLANFNALLDNVFELFGAESTEQQQESLNKLEQQIQQFGPVQTRLLPDTQ